MFTVFHFEVMDEIWLFLVGLTGILALVAIGLLGHLYGFHVYLMCYGMTTYDYIVMQREKEEKAAREREWREKDGSDNTCRNTKVTLPTKTLIFALLHKKLVEGKFCKMQSFLYIS